MASVRPEFGPTLTQLAGPHWAKLPRVLRLGMMAAGALIALALAVSQLGGGSDELKAEIVRGPVTFNIGHRAAMQRVATHPGELLRLESEQGRADRQEYVVRPLRLPTYRGDVSAGFLIASARVVRQLRKSFPAFAYRGEGRARVNTLPGYQVLFQTTRDGHTVYGKRVMLVPDEPGARDGVEVTLLADRSVAVVNVDAVGNNGLLKAPLRSFRFGTERP